MLHVRCVCLLSLVLLATGQHNPGGHSYRRQMNLMRSMAQKAYEHGLRINEQALCSKPRAELVYLTDSNKIYLPRATLLHRCSDLVGCCPHATHSCQPSRVEKVDLYFFTVSVQSTARARQNQNIEQISFVNHTECACMPVEHAKAEQLRNDSTVRANLSQYDDRQQQQRTQNRSPSPLDKASNPKAPMYGSLGNADSNKISNSAYEDNPNMLKYWARLLGLYTKSKVFKTQPNKDDRMEEEDNKEEEIDEPEIHNGQHQQPGMYSFDSATYSEHNRLNRRVDSGRSGQQPVMSTLQAHHQSLTPELYKPISSSSPAAAVNGIGGNVLDHRTIMPVADISSNYLPKEQQAAVSGGVGRTMANYELTYRVLD